MLQKRSLGLSTTRSAIGPDADDRRHHVGKDGGQRRQVAGEIAAHAEEATDGLSIAGHA